MYKITCVIHGYPVNSKTMTNVWKNQHYRFKRKFKFDPKNKATIWFRNQLSYAEFNIIV